MSERNIAIGVRAHTKLTRKSSDSPKGNPKEDLRPAYGKRVMILDTETATDQFQNLNFGQAYIHEGLGQAHVEGELKERYLFYADSLPERDLDVLEQFASLEKNKGLILLPRHEFVERVFWPEIWKYGTLCVGFNLPFDLSRLAIKARTFAKGKHKDKFEFTFSKDTYKPTILLKPIDSKKAFVELRFPTRPKRQSESIPFRPGRFLDLKTLIFSLTNESHSLESACRVFGIEDGKQQGAEHGKITPKYLDYNTQDVLLTWKLYCKAKAEFDRHPIDLEAGKAYSPASIGKAYYRAMEIKPLEEKQPNFPSEIMGYAMAAYYGGRAECHYRNRPVKVYHTDVTSMYPSVFSLQRLWNWVIAEKLEVEETTRQIQTLIEELIFDNLFSKEIWEQIPGLVQVKPNHDLLPVRAEYSKDSGYQIGLNYLTVPDDVLRKAGTEGVWYTLADVISAKILSGKTPEILKAYRIIPHGKQEGLQSVKLRGEIDVDPAKDNFFKKVIEKRKEVKRKVEKDGDEMDALQMFLKILANSTSYGVYIEMNREELKENDSIEVFGLDRFTPKRDEEFEKTGRFYNPLIAVMITGAARLILAMMERTVRDLAGNFAFCDTDSMSVIDLENGRPEIIGKKLVERFKTLLPYDRPPFGENDGLLEAEDYNWERRDWGKDIDTGNLKKGEYYPLYCFMPSAKRYVLYNLIPDRQGSHQIIVRKKSDHGLGHLSSPVLEGKRTHWIHEIWKWIISREHGLHYEEPDWFYLPAFAQSSISKPSIFDTFNRDRTKPYSDLIKPFNFFIVSYPQTGIFRRALVDKFYCRLHKRLGFNHCENKSQCQHSKECYANLHILPVSSFRKDFHNWGRFTWFDKNTKNRVKVQLSDSRSEQRYQLDLQVKTEKDLLEDYPDLEGEERQEKLQWLKEWHEKNTMQPCFSIATYKSEAMYAYDQLCEPKIAREIIASGGFRRKYLKNWDRDTVNELMRRWPGIVTNNGNNRPDVMAHDLGYESADSLLHALLNCPTRRDFINNYVEQAKGTCGFFDLSKDTTIIKNYYDFIGPYSDHPELKYDGPDGEMCRQTTKGLLKRTHVIVKSIKHIGKEAETIQDAEEQTILPEESGAQQMIYLPDSERATRKVQIDRQQWEAVRLLFKEKARPRKSWADKLGISLEHFKDLISGRRFPSADLYAETIEQCKAEHISVPASNKPKPAHLEDGPVISRLSDVAKQSIDMTEFEKRFSENIFALNGTKYIYETPEVLAYIEDWNRRNHEREKHEKAKAIREPDISGFELKPKLPKVTFDIEDILEFQAVRSLGKSWKEIHVKLKDGRICIVPRNENDLVFRLGLLPKPSKVFAEYAKAGNIERVKRNGFVTERTRLILYAQNLPVSLEAVAGHYGLKTSQVKDDIACGRFSKYAVHEKNGKVFIDSLVAWKYYGKGEQVNA
jgi:hypothetical protein